MYGTEVVDYIYSYAIGIRIEHFNLFMECMRPDYHSLKLPRSLNVSSIPLILLLSFVSGTAKTVNQFKRNVAKTTYAVLKKKES